MEVFLLVVGCFWCGGFYVCRLGGFDGCGWIDWEVLLALVVIDPE